MVWESLSFTSLCFFYQFSFKCDLEKILEGNRQDWRFFSPVSDSALSGNRLLCISLCIVRYSNQFNKIRKYSCARWHINTWSRIIHIPAVSVTELSDSIRRPWQIVPLNGWLPPAAFSSNGYKRFVGGEQALILNWTVPQTLNPQMHTSTPGLLGGTDSVKDAINILFPFQLLTDVCVFWMLMSPFLLVDFLSLMTLFINMQTGWSFWRFFWLRGGCHVDAMVWGGFPKRTDHSWTVLPP